MIISRSERAMEEVLDCIESSACHDDKISRKDVLWLVDIAREAARVCNGDSDNRLRAMLEVGSGNHLEAASLAE